ncbi:MAG: zinc-ribbon domain-containing protein [Nitrospinota bacterium]
MKITCPFCKSSYKIADELTIGGQISASCHKCKNKFIIKGKKARSVDESRFGSDNFATIDIEVNNPASETKKSKLKSFEVDSDDKDMTLALSEARDIEANIVQSEDAGSDLDVSISIQDENDFIPKGDKGDIDDLLLSVSLESGSADDDSDSNDMDTLFGEDDDIGQLLSELEKSDLDERVGSNKRLAIDNEGKYQHQDEISKLFEWAKESVGKAEQSEQSNANSDMSISKDIAEVSKEASEDAEDIAPDEVSEETDYIAPDEVSEETDYIAPEEVSEETDYIAPDEVSEETDYIAPDEVSEETDYIAPEDISEETDYIAPDEVSEETDYIAPEEVSEETDYIAPDESEERSIAREEELENLKYIPINDSEVVATSVDKNELKENLYSQAKLLSHIDFFMLVKKLHLPSKVSIIVLAIATTLTLATVSGYLFLNGDRESLTVVKESSVLPLNKIQEGNELNIELYLPVEFDNESTKILTVDLSLEFNSELLASEFQKELFFVTVLLEDKIGKFLEDEFYADNLLAGDSLSEYLITNLSSDKIFKGVTDLKLNSVAIKKTLANEVASRKKV